MSGSDTGDMQMRAGLGSRDIGFVMFLVFVAPIQAQETQPKSAAATPRKTIQIIRNEANAVVERALDKPISFEFKNTPLADAIEFIRDAAGINVVLDALAFDDVGVTLESPISMKLSNVALRSALRIMLSPLGLDTIVQDEALVITSKQHVHDRIEVVLYPVADLVILRNHSGEYAAFSEELARTIREALNLPRGMKKAAQGTIRFDPLTASLVVCQAVKLHEEISELLESLRQAKNVLRETAGKEGLPNEMVIEAALVDSIQREQARDKQSQRRMRKANSPRARTAAAKAKLAEMKAQRAEFELKQVKSPDNKMESKVNPGIGISGQLLGWGF
ncbi:MAG: hypothetical protein U1D30_00715 [Planctomycetota bacterium]